MDTKKIKEVNMIKIEQSKTADSRTCDSSAVSKERLFASSEQHVNDVAKGMRFFISMMNESIEKHDHDKFTDIDGFYHDFKNNFNTHEWWDNHKKVNRHHLLTDDGVPFDVNLVDVIEMIVDCVMAGMARSGNVYPLEIKQEILDRAFNNTVELMKSQIVVKGE